MCQLDELIKQNNKKNNQVLSIDADFLQVGSEFVDVDRKGKDRKWAERKANAVKYAEKLQLVDELMRHRFGHGFSGDKLNNVSSCAEALMFRKNNDSMKLEHAFLCKDKMCPICQWRKSRKNGQIVRLIMSEFVNQYPKARYLHVTFTAKNVKGIDLADGIKHLHKSWDRLQRRKKIQKFMLGFVRGTEVTYNAETDTYNQHMHVLIAVKSCYFKADYIKQVEWRELWQKALQVDYLPIVNVQVVKANEKYNAEDVADLKIAISPALFSAILEVCKYPTKPIDLKEITGEKEIEVLMYLQRGLKYKRQLGFGGELKSIKKELSAKGYDLNEDELVVDAEKQKETLQDSQRIFVRYLDNKQSYYVTYIKPLSIKEQELEMELDKRLRYMKLCEELGRYSSFGLLSDMVNDWSI
ncbi:protein rep [Aerococcaceae bacterium zg-ZJ1578]|uniref:protein rep n=1 Tax=Aerococcaceae bacterium zg-252 TaxID=2796928 RepID=UPI001A2EB032|nr:protein rep [Aerococcaceae bacterium zg-1578]MBR7928489.1 protein rep [Aerococcaceae bacterium zg-ZUI334]